MASKRQHPHPVVITNLYDPTVKKVIIEPTPKPRKPVKASRRRQLKKTDRLKAFGCETYSDYLFSETWQRKKREYIRSGRKLKCVSCGALKIQLHHRTYEHLGNELLDELDPLCRRCHELAHKAAKELIGITLWNCSRKVAHLISLGYGTERFDLLAWNQRYGGPEKVAHAKRKTKSRKKRKRPKKNTKKRATPLPVSPSLLEATKKKIEKRLNQEGFTRA